MRNLTYCLEIGQGVKSLRGSDRGFDCRLTVVRPSADRRFRALKVLTVLLLILTVGVGNVFGDELTVADGTKTTYQTPVYGYNCDQYVRSQILYPASMLTSMNGNNITAMTFYFETPSSNALSSTFQLYLKEVASSTTTLSTTWTDMTGATKVFEGTIEANNNTTKTLVIEFDTPFMYNGGSLVFDLKNTASGGSYAPKKYGEYTCVFYGRKAAADESSTLTGYASSATITPTRGDIRPKTTFIYEAAGSASCPKPAISSAVATSTSTATISWTAGGEETAWNLQYKGAGDADWTSVDLTTSNTTIDAGVRSYGLTGLTENTAYQVKLKAVCGVGDESAEVSSSFKTPCTPIASLDCGFESSEGYVNGTYPDCWGKISSTDYPQVNNYSAATGTQVLRFYKAGPQYAILPLFNQDVKNLEISFYYKNYGYSETLQIGYMTDPADASTFVALPASESTLPYITSYNAEKTEISLSGAAVGARYIAFKYNCTSSWGASYVDDISVTIPSACKKPASLTATAASATSIDLSWTAKGEETAWQVQYRVGAGSWSSPVAATTNPFTLTGLTAQTTYEVQVRANCGGEQSDWSASAEATTLCDAQAIPWSEDFEGMSNGSSSSPAPDCWAYLGLNGGTYPYAYPYAYNDGTKYYKGTRALFLVSGSSADSYIILPAFDAPLNTLQLTFSHMEEAVAKSGTLVVGYMTDITNAGSFVAIDGGACTNADRTWTDEEISLASVPADVASTARLVIKFAHSSSNSYYSAIDDITVSELPACPKPVLTATNVIYNGATINWADGSEKKWKLQYKAAGDADWTDANGGALIEASSFALDGLTPGTAYQVKAQAECKGDWSNAVSFTPNYVTPTNFQLDAKSANSATISWTANSGESSWTVQYKKSSDGDWTTIPDVTVKPYTITGLTSATTYQVKVAAGTLYTSPITVTTDCEAKAALGYTEGFEDFTTGNTASTGLLCWDELNASHTNYSYPQMYVSTNSTYVQSGSKSLYFVSSDSKYIYAILPEFTGSFAGLQLVFSHKEESASASGYITLGYMTDIADATTFKAITTTAYTRAQSWNTETEDLSIVPDGARLAFRYGGASNNYYAGIDDIRIEEKPSCTPPTAVVADAITNNSASISWTKGDEENSWKLQYSQDGETWTAANEGNAVTKPFVLNGLAANTTYYVQVKAVCESSESPWSASGEFTTDCNAVNMPLTQAFASVLPECWKLNTVGGNEWMPSSSQRVSASYSMQYSAYTAAAHYADLISPSVILAEDANLTFQLRNYSYYGGVTGEVYIAVGSTITKLLDLPETTTWEQKTIDLSEYTGETVKFIFRGHGNGESGYSYLYIDDVEVKAKPCDAPTALSVAASSHDAVVTWTDEAADKWNLRWHEVDAATWNEVNGLTDKTYTISTGLELEKTYEVQVQAVCTATKSSEWTSLEEFALICTAPSALAVTARTQTSTTFAWTSSETAWKLQYKAESDADWTEENVSTNPFTLTGLSAGTSYQAKIQSACGSAYSNEVEFTTWCGVKDAAELPLDITNFTAVPECWEVSFKGEYSGIAGGKICFYGTEEQWAILPAYDIDLNKLSVTFTYSLSGTADFGYLDEPNGAFHAFASQPTSGVELNLAGEATGAKYIAIRYNGSSSMLISGVQVRKTPTCNKPTGVTAVPSVGSATISWTSDAEAWKLQYKTGTEAWTEVSVTEKPYVLSGLAQGTNYKVRVQATCAGEELSDWSDEVDFTTSCSGIDAIPYYADFTETLSSCWIVSAQDETYYKPYANTAMNQLIMNGGKEGASNNVVVMPPFSADLSAAVLSFEYSCSTGANNAQLEVGYVTDKADVANFTTVETLAKSSSWVEARVPATSFGGNYIAFRYAGASSNGDLAIRNLRVINQLVLADEVDNSAAIAANNGQTLDIQIGRTITCTGYFNTICLPFSLPTLDGTPLEGAELWAFKYAKVENEELLFRIVEASSIEAGKPYFIQFAAGDPIENPLFKNVIISATAGQRIGDASVAQLCGILQPEIFVPGDKTKLFLYNENALYWWNGDHESQLKSFRAYFYVNTTSGANNSPIRHGMIARIIKEEQTATGVDNVQGDNVQCIKMIENDQIVIIKNGVKYNVQGQVISK